MSIALDALQEGFEARLDEFSDGEMFTLVRTGETFRGVLMPFPSIDPTMELGSDLRELSTIQVLRNEEPDIQSQDRLRVVVSPSVAVSSDPGIAPSSALWKVVKREDNPADFAVKLWVVKVLEGTDTP